MVEMLFAITYVESVCNVCGISVPDHESSVRYCCPGLNLSGLIMSAEVNTVQ